MAMIPAETEAIPQSVKTLQQCLKIAAKYGQKDSFVSYWCYFHTLQAGLKMLTKTTEDTSILLKLKDWLKVTKKVLHSNQGISSKVEAQAHLEHWALQIFLRADKHDRTANSNIYETVQLFYIAQVLYDMLTTFGELSKEASRNQKYAQQKVEYIHNCLVNGETPVPGPVKNQDEEEEPSEDQDTKTSAAA